MDKKLELLLNKAIQSIIDKVSSKDKLQKLFNKHDDKVHFIPYKYRIFGGMLQSMNIQFANFLEESVKLIIQDNPDNIIIDEFSGKKKNQFTISKTMEANIDNYISIADRNNSDSIVVNSYAKLVSAMLEYNKDSDVININHDVDLLFKSQVDNVIYYVEIKYNDDHDTGKFIDINRKMLKTYAYLIKKFSIKDPSELQPILYYFNDKKMKWNPYLPESSVIYRGSTFFDRFARMKYIEVDNFLRNISTSDNILKQFDNLYTSVMK